VGGMLRRGLLAFALLGSVGQAGAAPLTAEQRADVVQTIRQALHDDPSILRDALTVLQTDDARLQEQAASGAIASNRAALFTDAADPVAGDPSGDVTVVEFYDPRCPYCRQMLPVMAALLHADPHVRLVYKDIPILGPASILESRALLAAQRQGGYLRLQSAVMRSAVPPTPATLRAEAERQGMDGGRFDRDMADPAVQARLDENIRLAGALHIEGTPAMVVGNIMLPGAVDVAQLQQAVAAARAGR
jgi:protein-disulfide isomerase